MGLAANLLSWWRGGARTPGQDTPPAASGQPQDASAEQRAAELAVGKAAIGLAPALAQAARYPNTAGPTVTFPPINPKDEIGVSGLRAAGGRILEEYLPQLRGQDGQRIYREMADNDPTVGAVLFAITMLIRDVQWRAEACDDTPKAADAAEFAESLMTDMSHTWADFIAEVLSMLPFGYSLFEVVYKKRGGPDARDPRQKSKFDDGKLGVRKIALRAQDTIWQWLFDQDGGLQGAVQIPWLGGGPFNLPIDKCLLFRPSMFKGNPEGRSILRSAYRPWYFLKTIQEVEAIGIERELAGLPVCYVPTTVLTDPAQTAAKAAYEQIVRDLKLGQQGGVVLPSNTYLDKAGNPTAVPMVKLELLSAPGRRQIETGPVKIEYQQDIARSAMADFLTLGGQKGSFALSVNKSDMFTTALGAWLDCIAEVLNNYLLPRVWRLNGMDMDCLPRLLPSRIANVNLAELGTYLMNLAQAGAPLFPDDDLEGYLRDVAHLPEKSEEAQEYQEEQREMMNTLRQGAAASATGNEYQGQPPDQGAAATGNPPSQTKPTGTAPAETEDKQETIDGSGMRQAQQAGGNQVKPGAGQPDTERRVPRPQPKSS